MCDNVRLRCRNCAFVLDGFQTSIWQHDGQDLSFRNYQGGRDGRVGVVWASVLQLGKDEWGMSGLDRMMIVGESHLEQGMKEESGEARNEHVGRSLELVGTMAVGAEFVVGGVGSLA
jgi:hypothetical protein